MMHLYLLGILLLAHTEGMFIFDFKHDSNLTNWIVVNDVVMGGRSNASFGINDEGHAIFKGYVSLENNGGFSSVRHRFAQKDIANYNKAVIRLKGDGKRYQFRVKTNHYDRHAYIYYFQTSGDWETIEIPLREMAPSFRGMTLDIPDYPAAQMAELAFLIGNKKAESFALFIDAIELQ